MARSERFELPTPKFEVWCPSCPQAFRHLRSRRVSMREAYARAALMLEARL